MESEVQAGAAGVIDDALAEGKSWCLRCAAQTPHRREAIEFLGNPVKASYFCLRCGNRVDPRATDGPSASRLRFEGFRLRAAAGFSFAAMLLLPLLLLAAMIWLCWRIF